MDFVTLFIQLVSGALGSTLAAWRLPHLTLGRAGNVLVGFVGGGLGGQILGSAFGTAHMMARTGLDAGIVVSEIASGATGGAMLMVIAGALQRAMAR